MNDYNELIERCKEICAWQDTGLLKGDALRNFAKSRPYCNQINSVSMAEAETLREVADAFIASVDRIAELESRLEISPLHNVDGIMARDATIKLQDEYIAKLEAERAEREKQGPVAHEYQGRDGIWRGFINQQHYKNTVEDGSWPIRALYAAPPITAPVRLTDSEAEAVARIHGTGGWQTMADMMKFSRAIETAVLRANGFKVEE